SPYFYTTRQQCQSPCILFYLHLPPTTEIYTLSLHDALPILERMLVGNHRCFNSRTPQRRKETHQCDETCSGEDFGDIDRHVCIRSEEHTSELQSRGHLVCRLLLEKKNKCVGCHGVTAERWMS